MCMAHSFFAPGLLGLGALNPFPSAPKGASGRIAMTLVSVTNNIQHGGGWPLALHQCPLGHCGCCPGSTMRTRGWNLDLDIVTIGDC